MALLEKLVWQIETLLSETITLDILSQRCAVSTHHMCRVFQQATGMSVMAYVRARRLSEAARQLATQDTDILKVAIASGYTSHEAFTRAFASYFGVLPSSVRTQRSLANLSLMECLEMKMDMIVDIAKPDLRHRDAFRVVGLSTTCSFENLSAIPGLWQDFNVREGEVNNAVAGAAYGVCCDADESGRFRYVAGVEAHGKTDGMSFVDIPANRYAVFTHHGHIADLPKTVYTIWNKCLPDAGWEPAKAPDFERYDDRFDPQTGQGAVEIWVPLR